MNAPVAASPTVKQHVKDAGNLAVTQVKDGWKRTAEHVQTRGLWNSAGDAGNFILTKAKNNKLATAGIIVGTVAAVSVMKHKNRDKVAQQQAMQQQEQSR